MLTKLEIFQTVRDKLNAQGERAGQVTHIGTHSSFQCFYRDDKGRKCAIGQLIPDDVDTEAFEGSSVNTILQIDGIGGFPKYRPDNFEKRNRAKALKEALTRGGVDTDDLETLQLLASLQQVHDSEYKFGKREQEFDAIAKQFNLELTPK
jgi:hypothetical protein